MFGQPIGSVVCNQESSVAASSFSTNLEPCLYFARNVFAPTQFRDRVETGFPFFLTGKRPGLRVPESTDVGAGHDDVAAGLPPNRSRPPV